MRDKLRGEQNLVIIFGSEIRGADVASLVKFGSALAGAKFDLSGRLRQLARRGRHGPVSGAAAGLPARGPKPESPTRSGATFRRTAGLALPEMVEAAKAGKLKAFYVVGSNPIGSLRHRPFLFSQSFVVVQDMFLTETATIADVVLPAANAYEKSGTFTNTCGDLQLVKKAGEVTGTKSDFEMIVRIADAMGFDVRKLVPFGGGTRADMGQSRGAQSGEADRQAVWLEAHGLEPKMSPFDPMAILDEIQRLVPGYDVSRMNLLAGNDQHTALSRSGPGAVQAAGADRSRER